MAVSRRHVLPILAIPAFAQQPSQTNNTMYGLIGKMLAKPGKRDELTSILLAGINDMPGCLSYVVAHDPGNGDAIWITEVWDSESSHKASLSLPAVTDAIAKARPLIASFEEHHTTVPVGGPGINTRR
jgi:quinol monooxygenase YgiN